MSEDTEIKRKELQEMARAILSEIYSSEHARKDLTGFVSSPKTTIAGADRTDTELAGSDNRQLLSEEAYDSEIQAYRADNKEELIPRLSRREFLEQRVLRRKAREGFDGSAAESGSGTIKSVVTKSGSLTQADLPEKLSDIFCRDARRYDGAFEKY